MTEIEIANVRRLHYHLSFGASPLPCRMRQLVAACAMTDRRRVDELVDMADAPWLEDASADLLAGAAGIAASGRILRTV